MHFFLEKKEDIEKENIVGKEEKYIRKVRGCSSYGRAFASHARGKGIDTPHLHEILFKRKDKIRKKERKKRNKRKKEKKEKENEGEQEKK